MSKPPNQRWHCTLSSLPPYFCSIKLNKTSGNNIKHWSQTGSHSSLSLSHSLCRLFENFSVFASNELERVQKRIRMEQCRLVGAIQVSIASYRFCVATHSHLNGTHRKTGHQIIIIDWKTKPEMLYIEINCNEMIKMCRAYDNINSHFVYQSTSIHQIRRFCCAIKRCFCCCCCYYT